MHFLKLIRYPNLLIIILTQYLMRWCIIHPLLKINDFELQFSELAFLLLVCSTVLITAGGYVINDYFDRKTDIINKPQSVIVARYIHRRTAMAIHTVFNLFGIILGFYISFAIRIPVIGLYL